MRERRIYENRQARARLGVYGTMRPMIAIKSWEPDLLEDNTRVSKTIVLKYLEPGHWSEAQDIVDTLVVLLDDGAGEWKRVGPQGQYWSD